jgi:mono/diheme cytochrome c family protein
MKTIGPVFLALALFSGGCAASATNGDSSQNGNGLVGDPVQGKTLFADNCAGCHANASNFAGYSTSNLTGVMQDGTGSMPGQTQLTDQDMADIVAYLQSL